MPNKPVKIVADANMFDVEQIFQAYGDIELVSGRAISREYLKDADALLVRSITPVTEELLADSSVRFVGTATSGTDHVDMPYLNKRGITFADAWGSNANAVVDYCFSALAYGVIHKALDLDKARIGLLGAGAVGGLFAKRLKELNIETLICDPPLAATSDSPDDYCELAELVDCDVISLHVPLVTGGAHPTSALIDSDFLGQLREGVFLINSCRGGVVDEQALLTLLNSGKTLNCIFDVWENEPDVHNQLVAQVDIATPHIAGYSMEAKSKATLCLEQAFLACFGIERIATDSGMGKDKEKEKKKTVIGSDASDAWSIVLDAFPLLQLSKDFKEGVSQGHVKQLFDSYRRQLVGRTEFAGTIVEVKGLSARQVQILEALGFG